MGNFIWACDFFTVTTASLRTYYVLFFIQISTRRIIFCNLSQHPSGSWVAQQFRNLSISNELLPRYLVHARDGKFTALKLPHFCGQFTAFESSHI